MSAYQNHSSLSLNSLGAGDLIDRAIRLYRNNFWTFVTIAAPPVLIGTLISIGWLILGRTLFQFGANADEQFLSALYTYLGNTVIWFFQMTAMFVVMGGASRNFVRHVLFDEKISFRETYKNARSRLFSLIGASILITFLISAFAGIAFYFGLTVVLIFVALIAFGISAISETLAAIFGIILAIAGIFGVGWLFFLLASRFAYVPQAMLVEGQGVFSAIGRSISLASGNTKRFSALFIFTTLATYSALALLFVPLGLYAYSTGIDMRWFINDNLPAWYVIGNQVISQISLILLTPVLMIGLCLLYVDERVRHEGYDIELMAAKRLGAIPNVPQNYQNPLAPALAATAFTQPASRKQHYSVLNLD